MKAVVHTGTGRFGVETVPDPEPGPSDLVVQVLSCGICGSDLKAAPGMPEGTIMGHEFCGEVVAAGREVSDAWPLGRLVASMPLHSCGNCRWCLIGEPAHCGAVQYTGLGAAAGGFAEYVRISSAVTFPLPAEAGEAGALVEPLAVGLHAASAARLQPSDSVLIIGGGAVGSTALLWARRLGAGRVVVSDPAPERRDAVLALGATAAHDPGEGPVGELFDVVIECVGGPGMAQKAFDAVAVKGRVVLAGVCVTPDEIFHLGPLMKEVDLRWAVYYTVAEFALAARLLADGLIEPDLLITGHTDMARFDTTFSSLARGDMKGKYLLRPL